MQEPSAPSETVEAPPPPKKKPVPPAVTAIILILLLGFMAWQFTLYFKLPRLFRGKPITTIVREKVDATDGDFSKLSKEEKAKLDDLTVGNGAKYFKMIAKQREEELAKNGVKPETPKK